MSTSVKVIGADQKTISTGPQKQLLIIAQPARLFQVMAYNAAASADYYLQVFDTATVPLDGAVPEMVFPILHATNGTGTMTFPDGWVFKNGIYVCVSSTAATRTVAASPDVFWVGLYRISG